MKPAHLAVLGLSLLSIVTTVAGVLLARLIQDSARAIAAGIGFSAGIMIAVSALELVPEAHGAIGAQGTTLAAGLGAGLLWIINVAIPHSHLIVEHGLEDTRLVKSV
jgi:ZIP family zinc transporter